MSSPYLFTPVGSGGSASASGGTGKNYLGTVNNVNLNGDFETGLTSPWSLGNVTLTSGLPTGVPTFGSGASGNLSIAAVTSGKLAGIYSLSYVSSAATTAGNMLHSDVFTIDLEDQAKVMTFKFYYSPTVNPTNANYSGTSSNSYGVAIYDVTNSAWVIPAGVWSMTQGSGVGVATGTFQTAANASQYRFVVYNANATSGAVTVLFDDFSLGPLGAAADARVVDLQVSTASAATTASTPIVFGTVTKDSHGSYNVSTGRYTIPVSGDYAVSTYGNTTSGSSTLNIYKNGSTHLAFGSSNSTLISGSTALVTGLVAGDIIDIRPNGTLTYAQALHVFRLSGPTSGDEGRVVALNASGSSTSVTSSATAITPTTIINDTHAGFSAATYTVQVSGFYRMDVFAAGSSQSYTAGNAFNVFVIQNGSSTQVGHTRSQTTASYVLGCSGSTIVKANAGDTLQFGASSTVTTTLSAFTGSIQRVSGPAVTGAVESVNARYTSTAGQAFTNSFAILDFPTKDFDSHNAVTTGASWKFTAPLSGKYAVKIYLETGAYTGAVANYVSADLYKGGVFATRLGFDGSETTAANQIKKLTGSDTINLLAGEYIDLRIIKDAGITVSLTTSAGRVRIAIERVGN